MRTVNFKRRKRITFKLPVNKIFVLTVLSISLIIFMVNRLGSFVSLNLRDYLMGRVNKENTLILKDGFSHLMNDEVDLDNLINVVRNSREEIIEVEFNMKECTSILSNITGYINDNLADYNYLGYKLDIPIGIISNNVLFKNLGPRIPIKVELGDVALGDVSTVVKEFGINNALLEVHITVSITTSILYPFDTISETSTYNTLLSSKVIAGVVPNFYNGVINSKSDSISLPLNE